MKKQVNSVHGLENVENSDDLNVALMSKLRQQFKLITSDGNHEIIAYERQALKAYYRAKMDLMEALDMDEDDGGVTCGHVTLMIRIVNPLTLKGTEWEIYQEFSVPEDTDDDGEDDNDDLGNIGDDSDDDDE